jgi:2'-5' RNA ligase
MRLFYAAYLSEDNMRAYQALVDHLVQEVPDTLRSVPHRTHHLTLAFLGEIDDCDADKCRAALAEISGFQAFSYNLGAPTLLVGRGRPRLVRVDVAEGGEAIRRIQSTLLRRLSTQLPGLDTRTKPPHVTLARFRKNAHKWQARNVERTLERIDGAMFPTRDRLAEVHLVSSTLTPTGPRYQTVARAETYTAS